MIHEFDTEIDIFDQTASIDVSYQTECCEDNYGREYTAFEIMSVIWKVKHNDKNGRTPCGTDMHASEKWFYLDMTEMLSKESIAFLEKEAEEHYEQYYAPDYSEHSPSRNRFFYEPENYPGSPIQVAP